VRAHACTLGVRTAVSLPEQVFQVAERHAKRAHKSRSQLYPEALVEYLTRHSAEEVTEARNRVLEQLGAPCTDPFVARAGRES
jgi:metal-responsive CopG/Arc/MetJ family transcriptional regulator